MEAVVALAHPRFHSAWADVFTKRVVADCMTHDCAMVETHEVKLDACCQYGCDVDLFERDAIIARKADIARVLSPAAQAAPWFDESERHEDPDVPSGVVVRTAVLGGGCLFLSHDARGCAIHRASLEQGWDFRGTKPSICRLFPLSYEDNTICISDDYKDYSCAYTADAPTLYRVGRDALGDIFGAELVAAMDEAEAKVLARRLPQVR
jgi:Fe-S-cluster containining protein